MGRLSPVRAASAVCKAADSIEAAIGRDGVAFLDEDDVARHDLRCGHASSLPATDHRGIGRRHRPKCRDRSLGTRLLHIAHRCVQEHDGKDRDGFIGEGGVPLHDPERWRLLSRSEAG